MLRTSDISRMLDSGHNTVTVQGTLPMEDSVPNLSMSCRFNLPGSEHRRQENERRGWLAA